MLYINAFGPHIDSLNYIMNIALNLILFGQNKIEFCKTRWLNKRNLDKPKHDTIVHHHGLKHGIIDYLSQAKV